MAGTRRPGPGARLRPRLLPPPAAGAVAFILKGYPRLSETFIAEEIRALEQGGLDIAIVSLRRPTDKARHPVHREIKARLLYLPEYLHCEIGRVWRGWRWGRRLPGYAAAMTAFRRDLRRDPTRNRVRRFGQALVLVAELPRGVTRLHAHFLHTPASVTRYAALLTGLPWSASGHAKDIWTTPEWDLAEKLAESRWTVTCTATGRDRLAALAPSPGHVRLVYHGLRLDRFAPPPDTAAAARDGGDPGRPVRLLTVCRLVPKKGMEDLLGALALLPADLHWRLQQIGGGPLGPELRQQAARLGLGDRIDWRGAQPQEMVLDAYRTADLFVLASRIAPDGDRDGLPNVLVEAASQRLALVATAVSAIPELVEDGATGLLAPPEDPQALAALMERAIRDPSLRLALGRAAEAKVRRQFDIAAATERLLALFAG